MSDRELSAAEVLESFLREEGIEETSSYATSGEFAVDAIRRLYKAGFRVLKNKKDAANVR